MIGVNLIQDDRRGTDIRVEVTSSNVSHRPGHAFVTGTATELAEALVAAAEKAEKLQARLDGAPEVLTSA